MTTAPATRPTNAPTGGVAPLPNAGATPHTPGDNPNITLTRMQKILIGSVAAGAVVIAGIGFAGSYTAVSDLARDKGFGDFSRFFTLGVDIGIGVFLALDLLLTWLRIPFPLLRQGAWLLTAATINFNAAAAWPDYLGAAMHAVIPLLFVIAVEAARHAVGRIADITADKHIDNPPIIRWFVAPISTLIIWRRMRKWNIRRYDDAIVHQREVKIYRARVRQQYRWIHKAPADKRLVLTLASYGMSIAEAIEMPEAEARKRTEAEARHKAEAAEAEAKQKQAQAEAEAKQKQAQAEAEAKSRTELARAAEAEAEAKRQAEVKQAEAEAKRKSEELRVQQEARLLTAETEAKLAEISRQQRQAEADAQARQQQREAEAARMKAQADREERQRLQAEAEARRRQEASEAEARRKAEAAAEAKRITSESLRVPPAGAPEAEADDSPKPKRTSGPKPANIGGQRSKRASEVEAVLALITEAGDPKSVSLEYVKEHFGLKHAAAWDRLSTARTLWADAQAA